MNAKEKAIELFKKYWNDVKWKLYADLKNDKKTSMTIDGAKQCAKILVEEILKNSVLNYSGSDFSNNEILSDTEYWNEVLKEIDLI